MQKKKKIYWLTTPVTDQARALENQLKHSGFHCDFFSSLDALMSAVAARRTTIVVIGDLGSLEKENTALRYLAQRPELQGVRFILTPLHMRPGTMGLAAAFNFRDILPMDLPPAIWAERFIFATSTSPDPLPMTPAMIGMNQLASVHLPARVVWISRDQIWIESRLEAAVGTTLSLRGSLADAVGLPSLKLEVIDKRNSFLFYRFSQATICKWSVPEKFQQPAQFVLRDLRTTGVGPSCRIFMAIETPGLRSEIIDALPPPHFKLSAALQRHGIPVEPRYFSPDIVLIEDTLAADAGGAQFAALMNNIEPNVPVLILGEKIDFAAARNAFHHRPIYMLPQKATLVREAIKNRFATKTIKAPEFDQLDLVHLPPEHILSFAEISIPARLTRLHPLQGTILTGLPVGRYALVKIESPLLSKLFGRPVFAKLTSTYRDPRPEHALHPHVAEFAFSDLDHGQRAQLSAALPAFVAEQMKGFIDLPAVAANAPAISEAGPEPLPVPIPALPRPVRLPSVEVGPAKVKRHIGLIKKLAKVKAKWRKDRHFRQTVKAVTLVSGLIVGLYLLVTLYEPIGATTGQIWSDSFKAFRDRRGR